MTMGKIIRLTESDLVQMVKTIINEDMSSARQDMELIEYMKPYFDSGCVTMKQRAGYLIFDIESPGYFEWKGFSKNQGLMLKDKLRKKGFISMGVGEYAKKLDPDFDNFKHW